MLWQMDWKLYGSPCFSRNREIIYDLSKKDHASNLEDTYIFELV
jgi:hypothetical protein